jgi:hypothetical protein
MNGEVSLRVPEIMGFMKFNPYPVLITTGALMFATVLSVQVGPVVSLVKGAGVVSVADQAPDPDVARHPDLRVASVH